MMHPAADGSQIDRTNEPASSEPFSSSGMATMKRTDEKAAPSIARKAPRTDEKLSDAVNKV